MKQRVAIARVLANDADVALMAEPFGARRAMTRERLQDELLSIWRTTGLGIVFVRPARKEAIFLTDGVVVMAPEPRRIVAGIPVTPDRPRGVAAPDFTQLRRNVAALRHGDDLRDAA